ncbi:MAG: type I-E CRISPR-associated protein Cse1/CasA [Actinomycetales bacterium]
MTDFDLTRRPWIRARRLDGSLGLYSLREIFAEAGQLRSLAGEIATQDAAVLRLLLAILHRTTNADGALAERWPRMWERLPVLPVKAVQEYLDVWQHRFDLYNVDRPFMQVAGLHTSKNETFGLERLVADVPSGEQFFTTRAGPALQALDTAEAARWLVHCHAFDASGIKSGAVGDPRVKGGKGYPIGCGWTGQIGPLLAEGVTLAETLLLNLVPLGSKPGTPAWEREDAQGPTTDQTHPEPNCLMDTLVWQSRRIRLVGDESRVTSVLICNGDPFSPQFRQSIEAGSGWRRSEPQEKKLRTSPVYMPLQHLPDRSLWRGLTPLLASLASTTHEDAPSHLSPALLTWLSRQSLSGTVASAHRVRLRAVGLVYGSNNSVVDGLVDDAVLMHAAVLASPELATAATEAVKHADDAVRALADLAGDLARAAGGDVDGPRAAGRQAGYQVLDSPYRRWLISLTDDCDVQERLQAWDIAVEKLLWPESSALVKAGGVPAFIGRHVTDRSGKSHLVDSGQAHLRYGWAIRRALPLLPEQNQEVS